MRATPSAIAFDPPPLLVEGRTGLGTSGERADQAGECREEQQRGGAEAHLRKRRMRPEPARLERCGLRHDGQGQ
jgi:hypothetical protein